jgi:hypothetical protein
VRSRWQGQGSGFRDGKQRLAGESLTIGAAGSTAHNDSEPLYYALKAPIISLSLFLLECIKPLPPLFIIFFSFRSHLQATRLGHYRRRRNRYGARRPLTGNPPHLRSFKFTMRRSTTTRFTHTVNVHRTTSNIISRPAPLQVRKIFSNGLAGLPHHRRLLPGGKPAPVVCIKPEAGAGDCIVRRHNYHRDRKPVS